MDLGTYKSVHAEIWFGDRFWDDTKHYAAISEILIFRDFSGGQSPKFCQNGENLNFDPLKNRENSKFLKSPRYDFVSPQNVSPD